MGFGIILCSCVTIWRLLASRFLLFSIIVLARMIICCFDMRISLVLAHSWLSSLLCSNLNQIRTQKALKKANLNQIESDELRRLTSLISYGHLSMNPNTWKFKLCIDGVFRVNDLRTLINSKVTCVVINPMVWVRLVLYKV